MNKTEKREQLLNAMIHHNRVVYHPQEICNMIYRYLVPGYYASMTLSNEQCNCEFLIEIENTYRSSLIRRKTLGSSYKRYSLKDIQDIAYNLSDKKNYGICPPCISAQKLIDELDRFLLGGYSNWMSDLNIDYSKSTNERNIMIYEYLKIVYKNSSIRRRRKYNI